MTTVDVVTAGSGDTYRIEGSTSTATEPKELRGNNTCV